MSMIETTQLQKNDIGIDKEYVRKVRHEVARRLALKNISTSEESLRKQAAIEEAIAILEERASDFILNGRRMPTIEEDQQIIEQVVAGMFGVGNLQSYLDDDQIENIDINGPEEVWITFANGVKVRGLPVAKDSEELVDLIRQIAMRSGISERRFDTAHPELDMRLPDGSRLSGLMSVTKYPTISVRKHRYVDVTLEQEIEMGLLSPQVALFLSACVRASKNIIVCGRTNSGKTTLLRALINEIPAHERIITIEQSFELGIDQLKDRHPDCIALEARLPNTEGVGEVSMADLVRRSLRMNPDRVIVGETLGPEIVALLNAMSQGFGSLSTIHSDSSAGAFRRISSYALQAVERLPMDATNLLIAGSINFVVHVELTQKVGAEVSSEKIVNQEKQVTRHVTSIREVVGAEGNMVISNEVFKTDEFGKLISGAPLTTSSYNDLSEFGYSAKTYGGEF